MWDVSKAYHIFQRTVEMARRQKHQLLLDIVFHVLLLWICSVKNTDHKIDVSIFPREILN